MPFKLIPPGKRKQGQRFWYIRGTFRGKRYEVSSEATSKKGAQRFLDEFAAKLGSVAAQRGAVTFRQAVELYVAYRRPSLVTERSLLKLCRVIGDDMLDDITTVRLVEAAGLLYDGCTNATKNRGVMTPAAAVMHYAAKSNLCDWLRVEKLREGKPESRSISQEQAMALLRAAGGYERLLLMVLFRQGFRITDALRLTWDSIDIGRRSVRMYIAKTDDWLTMPLHDDVVALLGMVFEGDRKGRVFPWTNRSSVYRWLRPLAKGMRIKFTPHVARHSFATWLMNDGASTAEVMEAGMWRDHKSVLRYAKVQPERVRTVINRIGAERVPDGGDKAQGTDDK